MSESISAIDLAEILNVSRQYIYRSGRSGWTSQEVRDHADQIIKQAKEDARAIKQRLKEYERSLGMSELAEYEITDADHTRFMSNVSVKSAAECWEWKAGKAAHGYGQFRFRHKQLGAHRFMYWLHTGEFPADGYVCHTCDNPGCVNPNHLYLGDHRSNMDDRVGKGYDMTNRNEATPAD